MDSENDFLEIALDDAVYRGKLKLVQKLVEQGADINKDLELLYEEKHAVMHTAVNSASIEIFRYLLANGGDMDKKDEEGYTPVEYLEDCPWKEEYREIQ